MSHQVRIEDVLGYQWKHHIAAVAGDSESNKSIELHGEVGKMLLPQYRVVDHGEIIYDGLSLPEALEAYNSAP